MSASRRNRKQGRRPRARAPQPPDFWHVSPEPAPPASVSPAAEPAALLRSLGTPPLPGQGAVAEHYLAAVVERAANLAVALAAAGEVLDQSDDD